MSLSNEERSPLAREGESDLQHADDQSLFQHFHPRLVRFTTRYLVGTGVDPEDVAQEAIWKAISNRNQYDPKYSFSTWVHTIARHTALDHRRQFKRRSIESGLDAVPAPSSPADQSLESRDHAEWIWNTAREVLTTDQHAVLWLKYGEEMSTAEIARVLGKTGVGIRVLLHRSRSILRRHLEPADNADSTTPEVKS